MVADIDHSPRIHFTMLPTKSRSVLLLSCASLLATHAGQAPTRVDAWYGRSVYFIVTDRFALSQKANDTAPRCDGHDWCGGTFLGLRRHLDYIAAMGFDALWITPVVEQVKWRDRWNGTGYHGYWAADFAAIETRLGGEAELRALREACAARQMLFMLDVVANHVGPIHSLAQVAQLGAPLDDLLLRPFHTLGRRSGESLQQYIDAPTKFTDAGPDCYPSYTFGKGCNHTVLLDGWFGDLADLNQSHAPTAAVLLDWIAALVRNYAVDGLRLDTALYMPKDFLRRFQAAAGVYIVGEVTTTNVSFHASFTPPLTAVLNFPVAKKVPAAFGRGGSLCDLRAVLEHQATAPYADVRLLGNFIDNHDGQRFLYAHGGDEILTRNALAFTLLWHGVPIVYYGTEQPAVSNVSDQRTSMWPAGWDLSTGLARFITSLHAVRRASGLAHGGSSAHELAVAVDATDDSFWFIRGSLLVAVNNRGGSVDFVSKLSRCFEIAQLPAQWQAACQGRAGAAAVRVVLGEAPQPTCEQTTPVQLCIQPSTHNEPLAFAVALQQRDSDGDLDGDLEGEPHQQAAMR